ncbi:MAG: enoyl-ACP reductase [Planctomycetaceae bacterium]|nr:enoyl-ACP reductase [Planctomycetaceae bacterium]
MTKDFLELEDKTVLVMGVANRKSIAYRIGATLASSGARVLYTVRTEERREQLTSLLAGQEIFVCDVESVENVEQLARDVGAAHPVLHGLVHSIAFADYEGEVKPFHETSKSQFLRAVDISCYSLMAVSNALKGLLDPQASVVTISISTTTMASENYGFMAPVKAALDSSLSFLAKSFSRFSEVRFNAVGPSLLKTSASAGIPGYVDSYLYAERVIPRGSALQTQEAANVAAFLLSPRSSGINGQTLIVDAAMATNFFDREIVRRVMEAE